MKQAQTIKHETSKQTNTNTLCNNIKTIQKQHTKNTIKAMQKQHETSFQKQYKQHKTQKHKEKQ